MICPPVFAAACVLALGLLAAPHLADAQDRLGAKSRSPEALRRIVGPALEVAPPLIAIAALGQARADGTLEPEAEARTLQRLLRKWALRRSGLTRYPD